LAVSPVIGVLLMLVVTLIIAAVVSGFAGSLATSQKTAPTAEVKVKIANTGYYHDSYFDLDVLAVSEPIATKDLKLITSWSHNATVAGGNTTIPGQGNYRYFGGAATGVAPLGWGKGVDKWGPYFPTYAEQLFGNFTLMAGTKMHSYPAGPFSTLTGGYGASTRYTYSNGAVWAPGNYDAMMGTLGMNWYELRTGDTVRVKLLHVPSGKAIFDADVKVEG
jgi:hypothetical protein